MSYRITATPEQMNRLLQLNSVRDGLTTVEGVREYADILGVEKTITIVQAAIHKEKVLVEIVGQN